MNKGQLKQSIGVRIQLRPVPRSRLSGLFDRDWIIGTVGDDSVTLDSVGGGYQVKLGLDHIYSFVSNPDRASGGLRFGFLVLHVQLLLDGDTIHIEPLPGPKASSEPFVHPRNFAPVVVSEDNHPRCFSWRGRDPLHLIRTEEEPRQLFAFARPLCNALGGIPGVEPQFNLPTRIQGEIVYELSADFQAKWRLLGGMGDAAGDQVLVIVPRH